VIIKEDLEVRKDNVIQLVVEPGKLNMKLFLLWNNIQTGSKTIYLDVMEVRIIYNLDIPLRKHNNKIQGLVPICYIKTT